MRTKLAVCLLCFGSVNIAHGVSELPQYDDLDLSSDGKHLLMVRAGEDVYDLVVRNLSTSEETTLYTGTTEGGLINWCRWGNTSRVVCSLRYYLPAPRLGQIASTRMFAVNIDGSDWLDLIPKAKNRDRWPQVFNPQVQDRVMSWLVDDPENILVQLNRDSHNRPTVYRVNIYTNHLSRVQRPRSMIRRWYATHEGNVRLAIGYKHNRDPQTFYVRGRKLTEFTTPAYKSEIPPGPLGFSADEQFVFLRMTNGKDRHGIYRVRLATGEVVESIYEDPDFDVFGGLIAHPETGEPVGVNYLRHHPTLVLFDARLKALFERISTTLPGEHIRLLSSDQGYEKFIIYNYGGVSPRYFLYDRETASATLIGKDFPSLADDDVVDLQPVRYASRDGVEIPAYMALPKGEGPHPTVLLPHGGPYARDSAEFDPWVQFMVNRGIAVLKPNYRGSVGYGQVHMQAGYKEWGMRMQEDLLDGLAWMVDQEYAAPERACVVGASYGGYTALVSAYKFSQQVSCAVSLAGISDLERMVQRLYNFDLAERNRERIQEDRQLRVNSPILQAEHFSVPVLLLHGTRDTVVRVTQSRRLAQKLKEFGKPHRYVEQPMGDHFMSMSHQRRQFFKEMSTFLDEHL